MKSVLNKIKRNIQIFFYSLFYGMKSTEDTVLHQAGLTNSPGTSVIKEIEYTKGKNRIPKIAQLKQDIK